MSLCVTRGIVSAAWHCQCHVALSVPRGTNNATWQCHYHMSLC